MLLNVGIAALVLAAIGLALLFTPARWPFAVILCAPFVILCILSLAGVEWAQFTGQNLFR